MAEEGAAAPRSLFSGLGNLKAQRKPAVKVNAEEEREQRELITGVEGSRIQSAAPVDEQPIGLKVVPKLENTFQVGGGRKFAPSFVPSSGADAVVGNGEDRFELAASDAQVQQEVQYGLQQRTGRGEGGDHHHHQQQQQQQQQARAGASGRDLRALELEKFKQDMGELPDATQEQYDKVGVEEFGMALLRGMGWNDGEGVGRTKAKVEAKEYIRRPDRLGLGAKPAPVKEEKRVVKMGDKPQQRPQDLVLAPGEDGRVRHMKALDEKLVPRAQVEPGPQPGKVMRLVDGRHRGLLCKVQELLPREEGRSDRARVRLHPSDEDVTVRCKELGERHDRADAAGAGARPGEERRERGGGGEAGPSGRRREQEEQEQEQEQQEQRVGGRPGGVAGRLASCC
jgi:G patch domain/KOW motif-containing protein